MQKNQLVDVDITTFSKDGHGLGQSPQEDGRILTVEVPFTMPGDKVKAALSRKRKGVYESFLREIITPSSDRAIPRCIHFSACGGCRWQHLPYEMQKQKKEALIQQTFATNLHSDVTIHPMLPCLPPWEYRNKMEFSFSSDLAKNHYLGLVLYGSRGRVFNLQECHLVNSWFADAVKAVRRWWQESGLDAYHLGKDTGSLRTLMCREGKRTGDRMVMLTVSGNADFAIHKTQLQNFITAVREAIEPSESTQKLSIFLRIQQIAKGHPTQLYEMHLYGPDHIREILEPLKGTPLTFRISPAAFFQPNSVQAEALYARALEMINISAKDTVYDLYCGTGTLGLCAAKLAKNVIGIELSPESVIDANENIKFNQVPNIEILKGDVGQVLAKLLSENAQHPDVVMVDPPRAGLDPKAIEALLKIKARKLLYISCNPSTQASNIDVLIQGGYRLKTIQPVDQFPQTLHVENIAILEM